MGDAAAGGSEAAQQRSSAAARFTPLASDRWDAVPVDISPAHVLAATYTFSSDSLFVLDETGGGEARLWTHRMSPPASRLLASFPRHGSWDRYAMSVDLDGSVLLAASSSGEDRHAIARLDAWSGEVEGVTRGSRPLLIEPLVDRSGYTLLLPARPGWPGEAIAALEGVKLAEAAEVTGDVAVLTAAPGPGCDPTEARLADHARIDGSLRADDIRLAEGATVTGTASYNERHGDGGTVVGGVETPLALPLDVTLPELPAFVAGGPSVLVPHRATVTLAPGSYGQVKLAAGTAQQPSVLRLAGGTYDLAALAAGAHARLECAARCEVRVAGKLDFGPHGYLGPSEEARAFGLGPADVVVFVRGGPGAYPGVVADFGAHGAFAARLDARRGTLRIGPHTAASGTCIARTVLLGSGSRLEKDEGYPLVRRRFETLPDEPASPEALGGIL